MKRKLIAFLLTFCLLCGCAAAGSAQPVPKNAVVFTDDLGRTVTVNEPERVAALLGSFAQIWMLAGGDICATADDAWEDLELDLSEETLNLGRTKSLSLEQLLAVEPDLVLASINTQQNVQWQEILDAAKIPTAYFDVSDFEDYLRVLGICTDITGRKDLYETYGTDVQKQIEAVIAQSQKRLSENEAPTVLYMTASATNVYVKNSKNNVLGEMLSALGCINIADSDAMLLENLSLEHILVTDPDFIFFSQRGDDTEGMQQYIKTELMAHPVWSQLSAVKNDRVYIMDKNLYSLKPNHRWGEAYELLEEILNG